MPNRSRRTNGRTKRSIRNIARRRTRSKYQNLQNFNVHRRLALYPAVAEASWLTKLAWYGSYALKLFTLLTGVTDDLKGVNVTVGAGSTFIISPGDIAAVSPAATAIYTSPEKEVQALRALPYERAKLGRLVVRIVPSVKLGERGGMYAAVLLPADPVDAEIMGKAYIDRFNPSYDAIVMHPRAKMSAVTKPINLSINCGGQPRDIKVRNFDDKMGWINAYPQYVLMVAYSDLAGKQDTVSSHYGPDASLFEIHINSDLTLYEAGEMKEQTVKPAVDHSDSSATNKIWSTNSSNINVKFFNKSWDIEGSEFDLCKIEYRHALRILHHYGRLDLIGRLQSRTLDVVSSLRDMEL